MKRKTKQPPKDESRDEIELTTEDEAILDRIWESDAIRNLKPRAELFADMDEGDNPPVEA